MAALLLSRRDIAALMTPQDYVDAVETAFRSHASERVSTPMPMHIPVRNGAFHAKGARLTLDHDYVAMKLNGNFPGNPRDNGKPTIQGVVLLCDAADGTVLAVMDSIEITLRRTAAASALAARYLAADDADCVAVCGCGQQARAQLEALSQTLPLKRALAWDLDPDKARQFARDMSEALGLDIVNASSVRHATQPSRVIVAATTARTPYLTLDMVPTGAFVAAVGADSPEKSEVTPELMAGSKIVVDVLEQAATMGDLHHAIDAGLVTLADVHAELGDLIVGRRAGRESRDETIVFDSTGTAIQDAASAAWILRRAIANNVGSPFVFGES